MKFDPKAFEGFGAERGDDVHRFMVRVPSNNNEAVSVTEEFGFLDPVYAVTPREVLRCVVNRNLWKALTPVIGREFNGRLREVRLRTGRWRVGETPVDHLFGRELCILVWAARACVNLNGSKTRINQKRLERIILRWKAMNAVDRWTLYAQVAAEGEPNDIKKDHYAHEEFRKRFMIEDPEKAPKTNRKQKSTDNSVQEGFRFSGELSMHAIQHGVQSVVRFKPSRAFPNQHRTTSIPNSLIIALATQNTQPTGGYL